MLFQSITLVAALAATVSAHGYVDNITISGTLYVGYQVSLFSRFIHKCL